MKRVALSVAFLSNHAWSEVSGFSHSAFIAQASWSKLAAQAPGKPTQDFQNHDNLYSRRSLLQNQVASVMVGLAAVTGFPSLSHAESTNGGKSFAPGGTLVEYEVGVTVGNPLASASRKADNSNVVFGQDYYFKFGTAPGFIEKGSTIFPKTMPFTPSQQRYDTMKKYRERVQRGIDLVAGLDGAIQKGDYASIPDGSAPEFSIRPMGLLANGFLASENTGTTNELFLARWYINEIFLDINDIRSASSKDAALKSHAAAKKAMNSYLTLMNRVITPKVGDPFAYV
ncbi:hypothetical protein IV203_010431 [Nitzschia inconspicua]|uniref:Uncharacterized protein n=1 Tax=Nitzschia inconspicua TaxID=303405 RepID=A0A9K3PLE6_9STRA|nr:hypothetical protein IV203_010431 [Nitzschia inconspicua]